MTCKTDFYDIIDYSPADFVARVTATPGPEGQGKGIHPGCVPDILRIATRAKPTTTMTIVAGCGGLGEIVWNRDAYVRRMRLPPLDSIPCILRNRGTILRPHKGTCCADTGWSQQKRTGSEAGGNGKRSSSGLNPSADLCDLPRDAAEVAYVQCGHCISSSLIFHPNGML